MAKDTTAPGGKPLKEQQIEDGDPPIAPGKEKPVSEEDAQAAKANRGR